MSSNIYEDVFFFVSGELFDFIRKELDATNSVLQN